MRPGEIVAVRPPEEILATLDENGALEGVPFMPEMLQYVGRRFTVAKRVEKICDTIAMTGSRRMRDAVVLEDLRCDGSGHGGCQAGCLIYWKEAWLRRADGQPHLVDPIEDSAGLLQEKARAGSRAVRELEGERTDVWRCQATEAFGATTPMKASDPRQYWREIRSGNVGLLHFLRVAVRALFLEAGTRMRLVNWSPLRGESVQPDAGELSLEPGDRVQVRSRPEIGPTLDTHGRNRGLSFDREMLPYCGHTYEVKERVRQIIDERTGRMIHIGRDCLILDGVVCSGERSVGRWFCPRAIYPYWREAWLRRLDDRTDAAERPK